MQKLSLRKFSILGLVLMAASAVTAAMIPDKSDKKTINLAPGSITDTSSINGGGAISSITCAPDSNDTISDCACTASTSIDSLTTDVGQVSSNSEDSTEDNTTGCD